MACTQYNYAGIAGNCSSAMGGIKRVFLANFDDVKVTLQDDVISTITHNTAFAEYTFRKNTGSMTSTANFNDENGSQYITTELSLKFAHMETSKRAEMVKMMRGAMVAVVETYNGEYFYLGYNSELTMTSGTGETGTSSEDANQYTVTLTDVSKDFPYEVDKSIIEGLLK